MTSQQRCYTEARWCHLERILSGGASQLYGDRHLLSSDRHILYWRPPDIYLVAATLISRGHQINLAP